MAVNIIDPPGDTNAGFGVTETVDGVGILVVLVVLVGVVVLVVLVGVLERLETPKLG